MNNQAATIQLDTLLNDLGQGGMSAESIEQVRAIIKTQQSVPKKLSQETLDLYKNCLHHIKLGRSFQFQDVLKTVVQSEQQRIQNETMGWRLAGGIVGMLFGLGDGFQMTDMFQAMAMGAAAGTGHGIFSEEDKKFLKQIELDWVLSDSSPAMIDQRLGRACSRLAIPTEDDVMAFSIRKGIRGEYLVPINFAEVACPGFTQQKSRQVLARTYDNENMEILSIQLYPTADEPTKLQSIRKVRWEESNEEDREANDIARSMNYEQVVVEINNDRFLGYRTEIPTHSDY